jgi:hypothetical protein
MNVVTSASGERMNPPLEIRKVRLRGLGGQAEHCVRSTRASATGLIRPRPSDAHENASFRGSAHPKPPAHEGPCARPRNLPSGPPSRLHVTISRSQSTQVDFATFQRRIHSLPGSRPRACLRRNVAASLGLAGRFRAADGRFLSRRHGPRWKLGSARRLLRNDRLTRRPRDFGLATQPDAPEACHSEGALTPNPLLTKNPARDRGIYRPDRQAGCM